MYSILYVSIIISIFPAYLFVEFPAIIEREILSLYGGVKIFLN
jgi:hypothetical protein